MGKCNIECIIAIGEGGTLIESEKNLKEKVNKFSECGYNLQKEVEKSYRITPLGFKDKSKIGKNKNYEGAIKDFNQKFHKDPQITPVNVEIHVKYEITAKEQEKAKVEGSGPPSRYHNNTEKDTQMMI